MFFFRNVYDVVIIGGGISGLFMANILSKTDLNILIIELSGSFFEIYLADYLFSIS